MEQVFDVSDHYMAGIGTIPQSGYEVNERYKKFNAREKFKMDLPVAKENPFASAVILWRIKETIPVCNFELWQQMQTWTSAGCTHGGVKELIKLCRLLSLRYVNSQR